MAGSTLRVIAGHWRSRRISAPPAASTRPMPDRIKEAIFDVLGSWLDTPGGLPPLEVLDLFAGSGSLGIEAVSRGAAGCVFVERAPTAVRVLVDNLDALRAEPALHIMAGDAWTCRPSRLGRGRPPFGLVFIDPPYHDTRDATPGGKVSGLVDRIMLGGCLTDQVIVVLHHERAVCYQSGPGQVWKAARRREYGGAAVTFLTRADPQGQQAPGASEQS